MNYLHKTRASSLAKLAKLPVHQHPADLLNSPVKSMAEQYDQILGRANFNQNKYISPHHQQLIKNLAKTRQQYSSINETQKRTAIAQKQYTLWNQYAGNLLTTLNHKQKLRNYHKTKMYQSFLVAKERNEERLALERFTNFAYEYSKVFKFDFSVHPLVLMRMVHPHFGYLLNFKNKLTIEEVFDLWHEMIAVSKIRYGGHSLHASQMLSFFFWKLHMKQRGQMNLNEFNRFLDNFKFSIKSEEDFKHRFRFTLSKRSKQFDSSKDIIRFDLWREVFLDHDL